MVIAVELQRCRGLLTGSYKRPREFNWNVGVILLVLTLLLSFTGYLLPDDQLGFWAVTVGTNMARATPLLGHEGPFGQQLGMTPYNDVRFGLLGGSIVDANALLRSYIWHCIGIPIIASIFMVLHFWRVRKDGGISGPAPPKLTMDPAKAPSYVLGLQEMLAFFDPWIAGVVMPTLIIFGLMVIPYIDSNPLGFGYSTWKQRKFAIGTFLFGFIILWVSMIFIGTFIRGPGWQWFWPGQTWDHNRL